MAINNKIKELAEKMFVEEGITAKVIASTLNITEQTITRWKKGKKQRLPCRTSQHQKSIKQ
ncbi:MAG: hypothetical protein CSB01_03220 [Bacteroidia bacterium]|nr:MAG: hypothetical protein CSB01_03220 [Bacteroidia bacterium]